MDSISTIDAPASPVFPPLPLRFTGRGSEYFGIWIVNLLLSIVTIGIYSAWAKVRRIRYFYRHTELAQSGFDFTGKPVKILVGRVVALAMLLIYNYSVRIRSPLTVVVIVGLALVFPLLLRNSFRFRLYNTSWRGTRFHFRGTVARAYRVLLLNGFLAMITLYVMAPFMHQRFKAYQHGNSWFGRTQCSFHARVGQFYRIYLLLLVAIVGFGILIGVAGVGATLVSIGKMQREGGHIDTKAIIRAVVFLYVGVILLSVLIGPIFHALITNLIWNNTRVGEHRIECRLSPWKFTWITVSNVVLVMVTLGLFTPWAAVRLAKYQVESTRLLPVSDLQDFLAAEPETVAAVGEEALSMFDFDIGL